MYPSVSELPQAIEMEKQVLAAMLMFDNSVVPKIAPILAPDDFFRPEHQIIYTSILKLYSQGINPDILSISEELRKTNELEKIGGVTYLFLFTDLIASPASAVYHAKIVKEKSDLRKLIRVAECIIEDAQQGIMTVSDIIFDSHRLLDDSWTILKIQLSLPNLSNSLLTLLTISNPILSL